MNRIPPELMAQVVLDHATDGVFLADSEGRIVWANPGASRITGYTTAELLQLTLPELVPEPDLTASPPQLAQLRASRLLVSERPVRRKDGTHGRVAFSWKVLPDGLLLGVAREITVRRDERPEQHAQLSTASTAPAPTGAVHGRVALTTLGRATLDCLPADGQAVELLGAGKPLGLVVYLACSPGRTASREHLIDLLWSDQDVEAARHSVRQAVWFLRQRVGEGVVISRDGNLTLCSQIQCDRDAFLEAAQRVDLERAVDCYRGDFLPSFATPGGADFEQWADAERFRLRHLFFRLGESLVRDWLAKGRLRKAIALATRVRDAEPRNETGWRLVLETRLAADDRVGLEIEARALEWLLIKADRPPEPATRALLDRVRTSTAEVRAPTPARVLTAELIGREREFAMVLQRWAAAREGCGGQYVHISAAAGLGKTRLLADVHARLRTGGARVVLVRANPGERAIPGALASELAAALVRLPGAAAVSPASAATLVALNPALSSRYTALPEHETGLEALRRRELALADLVRAVADEQPVALLIDDVHWADDDSRQLLTHLLSRTLSLPVLTVTTARPGARGAVGRFSIDPLILQPLSVADTTALLASLGRMPGEPWAQRLPQELNVTTRGVPLLILETVQLLLERGALTLEEGAWSCADAPRLVAELAAGGALGRRIRELDRRALWLLLVLAVAGTPLTEELLANIVQRDREAVQADLQALELRGLVVRDGGEWQPAHDEIAARAVEVAPGDAFRAANAALGRHLAARGRDDPRVLTRAGRHFVVAGEDAELARVLRRRILLQRRHGERRSARALAAELLGDHATRERESALVSALPLAVRFGLISRPRIVTLALLLLVIAGVTAALLLRPMLWPPDDWLVLIRQWPGDSLTGIQIPLRREGWESIAQLDAARHGLPVSGLGVSGDRGDANPSPDGTRWSYSRTMRDSGDIDLFEVGAKHVERRLTTNRGDDDHPSWSPDGRRIAFSTTRWSPSRYGDLAILDPVTENVTRLTFDSGSGGARWSPDGTRIAFTNVDRPDTSDAAGQKRYCWITVDGARRGCTEPTWSDLIGWYDADQLLIVFNTPGHPLARLDVSTGEVRVLGISLNGPAEASPDGRWIACFCARPGTLNREWYVFPTDQPELWRRLVLPADLPSPALIRFIPAKGRETYVDQVEVVAPSDSVPVHSPYRLQARARDSRGAEVPLAVTEWRSLDTSVARVDDTSGVLVPLRPGTVTIQVSAGGWRQATRRLTIAPASGRAAFEENWQRPLERAWVPYGEPAPVIDTGPGGRPAFWNHGDGWYESGAYSRAVFDARQGLGVEAWWSTPVNGPRQQYLSLSLISQTDSVALAHWDHRTGSAPFTAPACNFSFPEGDRRPKTPTVDFGTGAVQLPRWIQSGRWYRIRVQVLPDGRCGYALDGKPLGVSNLPEVPLGRAYRVVLHGNSLGNRMLVGSVEVWSGVREDVDWTTFADGPAALVPAPQSPAASDSAARPRESLPSFLHLRTVRAPRWH